MLQWEDAKSPADPKFIMINEILSIKEGEIGKGVSAHVSAKKIGNKACFVTIYLSSKERKTLELGALEEATMGEFCKNLRAYKHNFR
jgi:hypothetical protein